LQGLDIGDTAVLSEIIKLVKEIAGVYDFTLSLPAANVTSTTTEKIMPGTITIP
jgi:uncharacterized phage protein gp47/JayE